MEAMSIFSSRIAEDEIVLRAGILSEDYSSAKGEITDEYIESLTELHINPDSLLPCLSTLISAGIAYQKKFHDIGLNIEEAKQSD